MAWRILQSGPMIEVSGGKDANDREMVNIEIASAGALIEPPRDLSKSWRERYDANDPYVRGIVEHGEVQEPEDDDGERTFVPKGTQGDGVEAPEGEQVSREEIVAVTKRVEEVSGENERLVTELEASKAEAERLVGELQQANDELADVLTYNDLSPEALKVEAEKKGVEVKRGDGRSGDPVKADYVKALQEARSGS